MHGRHTRYNAKATISHASITPCKKTGKYMTQIRNIDNAVLKLSKEHQIIADYVIRFSKNKENPDPAFEEELHSFLAFLKKDLEHHFRTEELLFFPAALNGDPSYTTSRLVLNLQKEHGVLETRLKLVLAMGKNLREEKDREVALKKIGVFFEHLKNHARQEITELFPLINANEQCVALLKQYATKMKSEGKPNAAIL